MDEARNLSANKIMSSKVSIETILVTGAAGFIGASLVKALLNLDLKVKDKVLYGKYSGTEISFEGDELLIMRESDILAIL